MQAPQSASTSPGTTPRRRWPWYLLILAIGACLLFTFHRPLLTRTAQLLIFEESPHPDAATVVWTGDGRLELAQQLWSDKPTNPILIMSKKLDRLEANRFVPSEAETTRELLKKAGIPSDVLQIIQIESRNDWDFARELARWLDSHPEKGLNILFDRFETRRIHHILERTLGQEISRVRMIALPNVEYDETNWWKVKAGQLEMLNNSLWYLSTLLRGEVRDPLPDWEIEDFEAKLP
ncbi:MAG: hypothetical protein ACKO23_13520 [Gemmataceae bacterium]